MATINTRFGSQISYNSNNNENQNSSSSVDSSGYNSIQSQRGDYQGSREKNEKRGQLDMKSFINVHDGSNLTDISPILTCIRTLNESKALWNENKSNYFKSLSLKQLKNEIDVPKETGFCFIMSLRDGSCLYTSNAITDHLGYPKDKLHEQCFMNILNQKDHLTFTNHITQGLNACYTQTERGQISDESHSGVNSFFCRLRVYQGLKFGYGGHDKDVRYKPFKITLHINDLIMDSMCLDKSPATLCIRATATVVSSAYTIPEEIPAGMSFSTRHTASCYFSHIDFSAVPYLGWLPQDMMGTSVFDFYHTDDIPQLKDIYELVVKENGSSFRSKPYRFKVHNGCYIMLETEWSCFINPWSHKLEFVVGQHRALKGPTKVNIFDPCESDEKISSDEITKESQKIQKEIKDILSQSMKGKGINKAKRSLNKRKLASFDYGNCIDEGYVGKKLKGNNERQNMLEDRSDSDPNSVVMGDISPYREVNDSSISSETPPTVQQLRYQENIERFFASQPKTYSDGSDEYNKNEKSQSSAEEYQASSSGSGNGSGNTSKETSQSKKYETKVQESSSNSSKGNMSSFTTGDSGYGKSQEKDGSPQNMPSVSQSGSISKTWKNISSESSNKNIAEKFSSGSALTAEMLSAHNRINHKHQKQHQRKNKGISSVTKDTTWYQSKDSGHKHKKCLQGCTLTVSMPTQTDLNLTAPDHYHLNYHNPQVTPETATDPKVTTTSSHIPQVPHCLIPPTGAAPTPFFVPVVYMGNVPYYPPMSAVHSHAGSPFWQCPTATPGGAVQSAGYPFNLIPSFSYLPNMVPTPGMSCSPFPFSSFNPFSGIPFGVQSSGVTATSPLTTTTTTVACGGPHTFHNTITSSLNEKHRHIPKSETKPSMNVCDMQVDDTRSSSFLSSSQQSGDKEEDMDFESKKCCPCPSRCSDKVELSSEIAYRYQMKLPDFEDILKKDMEILKTMQQPELVNKQLHMLQKEIKTENEIKARSANDFCLTESVMLGMTPEENVTEELEYRETCLLQLMCEDS